MAGHRGLNGLSAARVVLSSDDLAPAQAPPLSTAAAVAMAVNNRGRRAAAHVRVRLLVFTGLEII